jgi:predicted enzyme related to lactoylglutathione lyase
MPAATKPVTKVATVIIPVSDQKKAIDFYSKTLGWEIRRDAPLPGGDRWVEVGPTGAETTIAIMPARDGMNRSDIGLATTDVDAAHAHLRESGVDTDAEVMRLGQGVPPMFTFRDPDGNSFRMVEMAG